MAGSGTAHLRENSILRVENLVMEFPVKGTRQRVQAVSNISFDVADGETLGLVGESGCGKSTTGKAIMQLPAPTSGSVTFDGTNLTALKGEALRATRPKLQMIFQDPISSLNPRRTITQIVGEPLKIWKRGSDSERSAKVDEVLEAVGAKNDPLLKVAIELERIALQDDYFVQKKLYPNIDFYSGITLRALGFPVEMFTVLFAVARTVGWIAQWKEMIEDPDQRIGRPRQLYTGAPKRDFPAA